MSEARGRLRWGILACAALLAACGGGDEGDEPEKSGSILSPPSGNHAPTISGAPGTTIAAGAAYTFTPTAGDGDGDALIFGVDAKPAWATFDTKTGELTGTPAVADTGVYRAIVVWVSDGKTATQLPAFDLTVTSPSPTNRAPQISGTPPTTAVAGTAYSFTPAASDLDGDPLSYTIANRPAWASFSATTGRLSGTPAVANAGTYADITITVSDGREAASLVPFTLVVDVPNSTPTISGTPPSSVEAGGMYSFTPTAEDADGDVLTFTVTGAPGWAAFDPSSGRLSGTPAPGDVGTASNIVIRTSDGAASAALAPFAITVTAASGNRAPTISGSPQTSSMQGTLYSFQPAASDPDSDPLTFTIANKPAWATFSTATGKLQGTPGAADVRAYNNIVIGVTDGKAAVALPAFTLTVASTNTPPTITGSPATRVNAGTAYSFTPTASDVNGNPLTFSIVNKPSWAAFSTATGKLDGTPAASDAGLYANIRISVSDGQDKANLAAFAITVNRVPTISGSPGTQATIGSLYSFTPIASDPDGDTLTFGINGNKPAWATFSTSTGKLEGTPPAGAANAAGIVISVSDGKGGTAALPAFGITVAAANRAPTISGAPLTSIAVGSLYSFTPQASDPDGDTLTFGINANKPSWATFTAATGKLEGTPPLGALGANGIVISVSDGKGGTASLAAFAITVVGLNGPPTISGTPPTSATVGSAYSFTPTASDPDRDTLTFAIVNKPAWAAFSASSGTLSGTPPAGASGASNVVISVSDGKGGSASLPSFNIAMANRAPTISGTPATQVTAGAAYAFQPLGSDPDGDTLTYSIGPSKPSWATFTPSTGRLSGTPAAADAGTTSNIVISVSDGRGGAATLAAFAVTVTNSAPTISGSPATSANAGSQYTFTPTASDPDPNPSLTFSIANKPSWATFTASTGRLQGTPAATDAGSTFANITISVSDGKASASLPAFTITVPNRAPTISGTPATQVMQGTAYSFQPTASDPDGNTLTFSIANKPSWATFTPSTGKLSGTPTAGDVGTTSGIVISVDDGKGGSASLAAFAVTVQAVTTGSALLTWVPPTQNTDGTALVNLASYKVYWGTTQGNYPSSAVLNSPSATSYLVDNLVPGTYFFVVTAVNSQGAESQFSNTASKVIQ
jgi:hypothetical protein